VTDQEKEIERLSKRLALWEECATKTIEMYGGCVRPQYQENLRKAAEIAAGYRLSDDDHNRLSFIIEGLEEDKDHDQWEVDFLRELQEKLA